MGLEWSWEANLVTYMSVKCDLDEGETKLSLGCMRDVTCLEVRYQCSYAGGSGTVHRWRWDRNLCTWMEMSQYIDGDETRILGPGSSWDRTWTDVKYTSWDQNEFDMDLDWLDLHFSGPEWRRESTLKELMQESWDLDADETRSGYRWDTSWDPDGIEIGHGWNRDAILGTWMELRHHLGGGESQISGHGLRWDTTWK